MIPITSSDVQIIMTGILLVGGVVYAAAQAKNGFDKRKSGDESDALVALKLKDERNAELGAKVKALEASSIQQGKEIAALQAQLKAKDELIERYVQLLQNRNPEIEKFMQSTSETLKKMSDLLAAVLEGQREILKKPAGPTVEIRNQQPT